MILHVAMLDKFIPPFVELVRKDFDEKNHRFWLAGNIKEYPVEKSGVVYIGGDGLGPKIHAYVTLVMQLHAARKVMLHGLFDLRVILILVFLPWVLPKCYWLIWGGDLYQYKKASNTLRSRIKEALRRFVIRRIGHLVTYIKGDVDLVRKWYGAKGVHHNCLMYLSNVVDATAISITKNKSPERTLKILLGNSADPSNNHLEALEQLLPYKDEKIKIVVPLSYGDRSHAKKVMAQGHQWFGEKFFPLTEFMEFDQYRQLLNSLDIVIFNHRRQQAMGNTITALSLGKTVFIRRDVSQWQFFNDLGIVLKDVGELTLEPIADEVLEQNSQIVQSYFSRERLISQLAKIFE